MQKVEKTIAGKEMRLETGRIARQSNGAVLVSLGETTILATVNAAKEPRDCLLYTSDAADDMQ